MNHIIRAVAESGGVSGSEIGKVDISAEQSFVDVPRDRAEQVLEGMKGGKLNGKPVHAELLASGRRKTARPNGFAGKATGKSGGGGSYKPGQFQKRHDTRSK